MEKSILTAIYFCNLTNSHANFINIDNLILFVKEKLGIKNIWNETNIPSRDPSKIADLIQKKEIKKIILIGLNPGNEKPFFTRAFALAREDPKNIKLLHLKFLSNDIYDNTLRAKADIGCAFFDKEINSLLNLNKKPLNSNTLVIGGGIAGIQASLEIANGNQKVILVEKSPTIGGHMAMFDKTFPTLDCAACILTPKMVDVGQHANIDLMTYCEVIDVKGEAGDFTVSVLQKARRVDLSTCIGCGTCSEKCPSKTPSEFDAFTSLRKAIYIPFPQAVPNKYVIDEANCIYVQDNGKCGVCVKVCPVSDCINLNEKDKVIEIKVGQILVATGFKVFDAKRMEQFAYGKLPNVITSLELERLVNASGPTGGNICTRTQDKKGNWIFQSNNTVPKTYAIIHCVGSRDENYNKYCSKVCCMYSLKLAHLIKEKLPQAVVDEYFIDMRAFGKGYDEFYERIKAENINMIRGRTATIEADGELLRLRSEDILNNRLIEKNYEMVVLSVGLEANTDNIELSDLLHISYDKNNGWFNELDSLTATENTYHSGITIAGVCQGPKDIPDTVAHASAAASTVLKNIHNKYLYSQPTNNEYEELVTNLLNKNKLNKESV